jgi:hypothetical protein
MPYRVEEPATTRVTLRREVRSESVHIGDHPTMQPAPQVLLIETWSLPIDNLGPIRAEPMRCSPDQNWFVLAA